MNEAKSRYDAYIFGDHWKSLRLQMFDAFGRDCQACGLRGGMRNVHHMVYRDPLESCTCDDLMVLCVPCHNIIHWWVESKRINMPKTRPETAGMIAYAKRSTSFNVRTIKLERRKQLRQVRKAREPKAPRQPRQPRLPRQINPNGKKYKKRVSKALYKKFMAMRDQQFSAYSVGEFVANLVQVLCSPLVGMKKEDILLKMFPPSPVTHYTPTITSPDPF